MKILKLGLLLLFCKISIFSKPMSMKALDLVFKYAPDEVIEKFMQRLFYRNKKTYDVLHKYLKYIGRV